MFQNYINTSRPLVGSSQNKIDGSVINSHAKASLNYFILLVLGIKDLNCIFV